MLYVQEGKEIKTKFTNSFQLFINTVIRFFHT